MWYIIICKRQEVQGYFYTLRTSAEKSAHNASLGRGDSNLDLIVVTF